MYRPRDLEVRLAMLAAMPVEWPDLVIIDESEPEWSPGDPATLRELRALASGYQPPEARPVAFRSAPEVTLALESFGPLVTESPPPRARPLTGACLAAVAVMALAGFGLRAAHPRAAAAIERPSPTAPAPEATSITSGLPERTAVLLEASRVGLTAAYTVILP